MNPRIISRNFWNLARGQAVGYVEAVSTKGFLFKHQDITIKVTSSNLTEGYTLFLSDKTKTLTPIAEKAMKARVPIQFKYEKDWFGLPWKGYILMGEHCGYITDIDTSFDNEVVDVTVKNV